MKERKILPFLARKRRTIHIRIDARIHHTIRIKNVYINNTSNNNINKIIFKIYNLINVNDFIKNVRQTDSFCPGDVTLPVRATP